MADDEKEFKVSLWPYASEVGNISPDQSFLGKPVDPDTLKRVRESLAKYKGPVTQLDRDKIIRAKSDSALRAAHDKEVEYLAWAKKVKEETVPTFRFPPDPKRGMMSNDEYIRRKAKKGIKELNDRTKDYKAWVEDLSKSKAAALHEQLQEKARADAAFAADQEARAAERVQRDLAIQQEAAETCSAYWEWLRKMKAEVAQRPNSAPPAKDSGATSAAELTKKKKDAMNAEMKKMTNEYNEWLKVVSSQSSFKLPHHDVVTTEEWERRAIALYDKKKKQHAEGKEYFDNIRRMEQKHHQRIRKVVQERLDNDKKYDEFAAAGAAKLEVKMEQERQRQRAVALEQQKKKIEMFARVKNKPFFIESAYK